jgi:hypothetical protein
MPALLKVDEEFRYAVAGMIGYDEILKRLQKYDEKFEARAKRIVFNRRLIKLTWDACDS